MTETLAATHEVFRRHPAMPKTTQVTFTSFSQLKTEFFEAVEGLNGDAANHNGTAIRPGQLLEYICAMFILAGPRERVEMARRAEEAHSKWLKNRPVKDGDGQHPKLATKTTSGVAMVPATGRPETKKKGKRLA